jgi:tetratricopeptide (TPR) repeat protein
MTPHTHRIFHPSASRHCAFESFLIRWALTSPPHPPLCFSASITQIVGKDAAKALAAKTLGNTLFATGQFEGAIDRYSEALALCPIDDKANAAIYYANRAACHLNRREYDRCVADCTASLALTPGYVRVLMRRAKAYESLDRPADALTDVEAVCTLEPSNAEARSLAVRLKVAADKKFEQQKDEMMGNAPPITRTAQNRDRGRQREAAPYDSPVPLFTAVNAGVPPVVYACRVACVSSPHPTAPVRVGLQVS